MISHRMFQHEQNLLLESIKRRGVVRVAFLAYFCNPYPSSPLFLLEGASTIYRSSAYRVGYNRDLTFWGQHSVLQ